MKTLRKRSENRRTRSKSVEKTSNNGATRVEERVLALLRVHGDLHRDEDRAEDVVLAARRLQTASGRMQKPLHLQQTAPTSHRMAYDHRSHLHIGSSAPGSSWSPARPAAPSSRRWTATPRRAPPRHLRAAKRAVEEALFAKATVQNRRLEGRQALCCPRRLRTSGSPPSPGPPPQG